MSNKYPNAYYEQLANMIINNPSISLNNGEVCFYEGVAKSYKITTKTVKEKPKKKTSFFLNPLFVGIKRVKETVINEVSKTEYANGKLYITNMRVVFKCKIDGFNLLIPDITKVDQHSDGIRVIAKGKSYDVMTNDLMNVLHVFELINKAQSDNTSNENSNNEASPSNVQRSSSTVSRNDDYAIAAFINYGKSGKPVGKNKDSYPRYFEYEFRINDPLKYHKRVIEEGYFEVAPLETVLNTMKVGDLKQILENNNLSTSGKKTDLISRILENVELSVDSYEKIYVPSQKGIEHLKKYEYLFYIKRYGVTVEEYEKQMSLMPTSKINDIIWRILNDKFNKYNLDTSFSLARNELLHMAFLLDDEERNVDALFHYILVLYYDMRGCEKEDLTLAPAITSSIFDKREYFKVEMVDRCYERYTLPQHCFTKESFLKLLNKIFDDETIDLSSI